MYDSKTDKIIQNIKEAAIKKNGKPLKLQFSAPHGGFHSPCNSDISARLNKIAYSRNPINETDQGNSNAQDTIKMVFEHIRYQLGTMPKSLYGQDLSYRFTADTKANGYTYITAHKIAPSRSDGNWLNDALKPTN